LFGGSVQGQGGGNEVSKAGSLQLLAEKIQSLSNHLQSNSKSKREISTIKLQTYPKL
jgi:ribosomal protein S15P/S13E